ncbi:hypothetical protein HK104_001393 [Borealophlyctis nickersoniae]|nr:hypothetical protein HK104_001393 [Borealophlyctis nickersoniae]
MPSQAVTIPVSILGALVALIITSKGLTILFRRNVRKLMAPTFTKSKTPSVKPDAVREEGVLYVHLPDLRPWGHPNASPFSLKLETYLLMAKIPYVAIRGFNLKEAPKGKYPYIEIDGKKIGDSELIIQFLKTRFPTAAHPSLSGTFTPSDLAVGHAFTRMVSEHMVACMGYSRNVENVEATFKAYTGLDTLPMFARIMTRLVRRGTGKKLALQGIGRHSREEIYEIGCRDMKAISDFLGTNPFILGTTPSEADASVFAMLAEIMWIPVEFPMKTYAYDHLPNLDAYLHRVKRTIWGDTIEPWYTGGKAAEDMYKRLGKTVDELLKDTVAGAV